MSSHPPERCAILRKFHRNVVVASPMHDLREIGPECMTKEPRNRDGCRTRILPVPRAIRDLRIKQIKVEISYA